ncbi:MAG: preprotein translocase subunit SecG [Patescibacteria group bacterium]
MNFLNIALVAVSVIIVGLVLLQDRTGGTGGVFGGGEAGGVYQRRRGLEKSLFTATIVFAVAFAVLSALALVS